MREFVLFLTIFRIISAPIVFFLLVFFHAPGMAFVIFIAASFSDYFDGNLARRYKVESLLGAILDPVADKILVLFTLFAITLYTRDPFLGTMSVFLLAREFWVSALREYASQSSNSDATKVTFLAKIKTSVQFIAIAAFFLGFISNFSLLIFIASFILFLSVIISIKTALDYSQKTFAG